MLQWERLAPYNAAQYATLNAKFDCAHAQASWRDASVALGLQQIGQSPDAVVANVTTSTEAFVTAELNRPFETDDSPLRPFVIRDAARPSIGIFYRHVVADSSSIRCVIRAWIDRLLLRPIDCPPSHIALLRDGEFHWFDDRRNWNAAREAIADTSRLSRTKRVRRLLSTADPQSAVGWRRVEMPSGLLPRLTAAARRDGVRVNDLFVAAAALACDRLVPHEEVDGRPDLGIGTIADVRPHDRPANEHFGLMLGFLQTFWRRQDLKSWPRALLRAAEQSRVARERGLAGASVIRSLVALHLGKDLSLDELANFYRKRCPLAAGISNVNLKRGWPASLYPSPIASYTRVSPLGPILPLVFTPTTLGASLHIGVTHRTSVLSTVAVDAIVAGFVGRLEAAC